MIAEFAGTAEIAMAITVIAIFVLIMAFIPKTPANMEINAWRNPWFLDSEIHEKKGSGLSPNLRALLATAKHPVARV